jgi:hypothetical protein
MATELEERMALTKPGQVTWAKPELGRRCETCVHMVDRSEREMKGVKVARARCALVKAHTGKRGLEFAVQGAIACSQYRGP